MTADCRMTGEWGLHESAELVLSTKISIPSNKRNMAQITLKLAVFAIRVTFRTSWPLNAGPLPGAQINSIYQKCYFTLRYDFRLIRSLFYDHCSHNSTIY
jgi:hypothetical protein